MDTKILFNKLIQKIINENFSDLHLNCLHKPFIRNHYWELEEVLSIENDWLIIETFILTQEILKDIIILIAWEIWLNKFLENLELDISYKFFDSDRFRINCYADTNGYSIAMRKIPIQIPTLEELWLWENIKNMCQMSKWLILMTGPTWSWKSTNLAAMIEYINKNFKKHILTIEDPVEFAFNSKKCLINQREIGNSTLSFANAIKSSLREDPNIIMVWEMRDPETIKAAITLAETWHLVLSTLHTNDTVQSIDRIIDVFPASQQDQIRMQLSMSLIWIISQRLVPRIDKEWRIAIREIMIANDAIRNLINTWKSHQLYSVIEVWQKDWMILMDKYLITMYKKWIIDKDTLRNYARDKESIELI